MAKWQKMSDRRFTRPGGEVRQISDGTWLATSACGSYWAYVAKATEGMDYLNEMLGTPHAATMAEGLKVADEMGRDVDYHMLGNVLEAAYRQAATGKGRDRHANALPFDQQQIMQGARKFGIGSPLGQVDKKTAEATGMARRGEYAAAEAELLGAIVYLAAAVLRLRELAEDDDFEGIKIGGSA